MHGAGVFRAALDEKLDLARAAAVRVAELPGVEMIAEPELSLFAFRIAPPGTADAEADALTRKVLAGVNARRRVFLTGAIAAGRFVIRVCVLSFRTHADRMQMLLEDLVAALAEARGE
jgi:aromatic-L-amino-acid decarboxylase